MNPTSPLLVAAKIKDPDKWLQPLIETCVEFEINTEQRVAAFLAQTSHESGGYTMLVLEAQLEIAAVAQTGQGIMKRHVRDRGLRIAVRQAVFCLAQLALDRRGQARQVVLHDVIVRAAFHGGDGDILADALGLLPRYCPEWTNHNPSDPGITLLELAAWMSEMLIFRLNQVPEKNYVAVLNLLGIKLHAPRAAKVLLQFALVEGTAKQRVQRGTQASTPQAGDDSTVTFETGRDLTVTSVAPCWHSRSAASDRRRKVERHPPKLPRRGR